ncbi:hypothetical protein GCM10020255_074020 [Rhodococcus baikonurensis]
MPGPPAAVGSNLGTEFDAQDSADDQGNTDAHRCCQRVAEKESCEHGGQDNSGCAPDSVCDTESHALPQDERQGGECREISADDHDVPSGVIEGGAQRQSRRHLGQDRGDQQ